MARWSSRKQLAILREYVAIGREEGELVTGGHEVAAGLRQGLLLTRRDLRKSHRNAIAQEEIFGPVLSVIRYRTGRAMRSPTTRRMALPGRVSRDIARAERVAAQIRTGTMWINDYHVFSDHAPFRRATSRAASAASWAVGASRNTPSSSTCTSARRSPRAASGQSLCSSAIAHDSFFAWPVRPKLTYRGRAAWPPRPIKPASSASTRVLLNHDPASSRPVWGRVKGMRSAASLKATFSRRAGRDFQPSPRFDRSHACRP